MSWRPPKKRDIQIRESAKRPGHFLVKCLHGSEQVEGEWFALLMWHASAFGELSTNPHGSYPCNIHSPRVQ